MTELIAQLAPYALVGFGALVGVGGSQWHSRRNGNGWNGKERRAAEPAVTQRECELIHKGINTRLDEGNQKMGRMEVKLDDYTQKVTKALTIVEEHTRNK